MLKLLHARQACALPRHHSREEGRLVWCGWGGSTEGVTPSCQRELQGEVPPDPPPPGGHTFDGRPTSLPQGKEGWCVTQTQLSETSANTQQSSSSSSHSIDRCRHALVAGADPSQCQTQGARPVIGQADGRDALDWSAEGILFKARRDIRLPVARYYGTCVVLPTCASRFSMLCLLAASPSHGAGDPSGKMLPLHHPCTRRCPRLLRR